MMGSDAPPDRSHIATEALHGGVDRLHAMSVPEITGLMNREDAHVIGALERALPSLNALIHAAEPGFVRGGRLVYVGAGTSGRLGVLDASEAPPTFQVDLGRVVGVIAGGDAALRRSSESLEDDPNGAHEQLSRLSLTDDDTIIAIAAGGTTPYPRGSLRIARRFAERCVTGFLSCAPVEPPEACDHHVVMATGPEMLAGSTRLKAGTATKLALNTISTTLMIRSGRVYRGMMVELRATNDKLRDRAARILSALTGCTRDAAFAHLEDAAGDLKQALVAHRLGVGHDQAARLLEAHRRDLSRILPDEPPGNRRG